MRTLRGLLTDRWHGTGCRGSRWQGLRMSAPTVGPDVDDVAPVPPSVERSPVGGGRTTDVAWHHLAAEDVLDRLGTSSDGLGEEEAKRRLEKHGFNRLQRSRPVPWWRILLDQFTSPVVLLLVAAAVVSLAIGEGG